MNENCVLSVPGYGYTAVDVVELSHGIKITGTSSENRNSHVFYPMTLEEDAFSITVEFANHGPYNTFSVWLVGYGLWVSNPDRVPVSMKVDLPSRNFVRQGVPVRGMTFGKSYDDVVFRTMVTFVPVEDQLSYNSPLLSTFQLGASAANDPSDQTQYFYPAGVQLDETAHQAELIREEIGNAPVDKPGKRTPGGQI